MRKLLVFLFLSAPCFGQAWSGILTSDRATDWTQSGIPGGIPSGSWTQCGSTIAAGASTATINSALASCGNNQYVLLGAGSFTLSTNIVVNRSNVVLRGSGTTQTTVNINGHDIFFGNGSGGQGSTPGGLNSTALTTLADGATSLTVASSSGMSTGMVVAIMQNNPSYVQPTGNENNENATWCRSPLAFFGCSTMSMFQFARITSVPDSTHIVIEAPGLNQTYTSGLSPIVVFWSTTGVYFNDGLENMKIDIANAADTNGVSFVFCHECWAKNLFITRFSQSSLGAIYLFFSYRPEIRDSYISAQNAGGGPTQYGIAADRVYAGKIENNILYGVTTPINLFTNSNTVVGYNYTLRTPVDNVFPQLITHRAHSYNILHEGNISARLEYDFVHGSASHNTSFRNRFDGNEPNGTNYRVPWEADASNRYMNAVGNVLGSTNFHTAYECTLAHNTGGSDIMIYDLGWNNGCEAGGSTGYDTVVESSLIRWGNWDAVTQNASGATAKGTHYCTGTGSGVAGPNAFNTNCLASETANSDPTFPGLANPSTTLPSSFYLASTPSWFGSVPFPPIGPDVTCSSNCIANVSNHANKNPAQICYEATAKDGSGFLTAFDGTVCYGSGGGSSPIAQLSPTSFTFTGQLVNTTSTSQTITVSNIGTATLNVSARSVSGDYAISGGTCGAAPFTVAASSSCTVLITFTPIVIGSRSGTFSITDNASGSPHTASLSGTGVPPTAPVTGLFAQISKLWRQNEIQNHLNTDFTSAHLLRLPSAGNTQCSVDLERFYNDRSNLQNPAWNCGWWNKDCHC